MYEAWRPLYKVGDAVRIVFGGLPGVVVEVDLSQRVYVIEVNRNSSFRLLCTEGELKPNQ